MAGRACSVDPRGDGDSGGKKTKILQTQHTAQGPRRGVLHVRLFYPSTDPVQFLFGHLRWSKTERIKNVRSFIINPVILLTNDLWRTTIINTTQGVHRRR